MTTMHGTQGAEALDDLFWRAEILQAMFWMRGEGIATEVAPAELAAFLQAKQAGVEAQMHRLAADGYLEVCHGAKPGYRLTSLGVAEGGRSFRDEFDGLTRPAHGECGPGCWCRDPDHTGEPCPNQPVPDPSPPAEAR